MELAKGVRVHASGYGERIASRASRAPLRGSLRSALTGCRLTPTARSADGPVKRWLPPPVPGSGGPLVIGSVHESGLGLVTAVARLRCAQVCDCSARGHTGASGSSLPHKQAAPDGSSATRAEQPHGRALDAFARGLLAFSRSPSGNSERIASRASRAPLRSGPRSSARRRAAGWGCARPPWRGWRRRPACPVRSDRRARCPRGRSWRRGRRRARRGERGGARVCASSYPDQAVRGLRASSALRIWTSWASGVLATGVPPVAGLSRPVMPHSRFPSRLPGPWTASMRSWIWFVRTTRPSTFRLIGPRSSERIEHALPAGSGGSGSGSGSWLARACELPAAALLATAAGTRTPDFLIFLLPALPLKVPTE